APPVGVTTRAQSFDSTRHGFDANHSSVPLLKNLHSLIKPSPCHFNVGCSGRPAQPARSNQSIASRAPAARLKRWTIRYSSPRPLRRGFIGLSSYIDSSSHRLPISSRGPPGTGRALGLSTSRVASAPASLRTFTRYVLQPCSTRTGRPPRATARTLPSFRPATAARQSGPTASLPAVL